MSDPQAVHCPHKLPCLLLLSDCVNETRKANTTSFPFILPFIAPIRSPSPHPNLLSFSLHLCSSQSANLRSHLNSTQHTHSRCLKDPLFLLYGAIVLQNQLTLLSLNSMFNLQSYLSAVQRKGDLRFTSHKSSAPFTSRWFGSHSIQIFSSLVGDLHTHSSGGNPVLLFVSQWKFTYAIINPEGIQQCQA